MSRPESDPGTPDLDSLLSLGTEVEAASGDNDRSEQGPPSGSDVGCDAGGAARNPVIGEDPAAAPVFTTSEHPAPGQDRGTVPDPGTVEEIVAPDGVVGELHEIDIDAIVRNEYQPRRLFDDAALADLTESVRALGVLQPVLVRPAGAGVFELIAGERRWRAARRAGLPTIPAIVRSTGDQGSLEQAIVENLHRTDLTALEEAFAYQQLVDDFSLTQDEIAARVGKSRSAVSNTLRLFQLPPSVQRMIGDGVLSAGHARAILGLDGAAARSAMAQRVVAEDLSVRATERAVRSIVDGVQGNDGSGDDRSSSPGGGEKSAGALEVEQVLEERLATGVEVVEGGGNGRIVIRFADGKDLDRIYRLLTD